MEKIRLKRRNKEGILKKIWSKNTLPIILFIMVFLNYFTLIRLNYNTKQSFAAGTDTLVPAFGIGFIILFFFYIKKIKISKKMLIQFGLLVCVTFMWSIVQFINVKFGNYYLFDIFNIACKFVNILFLFVLLINMELDEKYIYNFMRCLVLMGIVSCVFNFIIYYEEILAALKIITINTKTVATKSFFAQKNQFAYVLFTCIVSCIILILHTPKKKFKVLYSFCILLFLFNMIFTESRTGLAITALFLGLYLLFNDRMKVSKKLILITILGVIGAIGIFELYKYNPELLMNKLVRADSIKTLTGRTRIWDISLAVTNESTSNLLFGAGRFRGIDVINNAKLPFTQFHNTYIEFLVSGGIVELIYFILIYLFVIITVIKSKKLSKKYKIIYICLYISYFVYMFSESLGRFSIGGSDCLGLIFFVTMPMLHANSNKEDINVEQENKELINEKNNILENEKSENIKQEEEEKQLKIMDRNEKRFFKSIKENLPLILFIVIFINYVPLILPNMVSKDSFGVGTILMMICFIIEILILVGCLFKKVKLQKENKINLILLGLVTAILLIVQVVSFITTGKISFMDIMNIGCIFINLLLLVVAMLNIKVNEEHIYTFFKCIIYMSLAACLVNVILYFREIIITLGLVKSKEWVNIKSFFANRNQFAFFLYLGLIANFMVMQKSNKLIYKIALPVFLVNLVLTMSRTGIMVVFIMFALMILLTDKISRKTKIITIIVLLIMSVIGIFAIRMYFPKLWNTFDKYFLRIERIKDLSGRTDIWKVGTSLLFSSPFNFIFGVGRFKSTSLLDIDGKVFTQFHNIYLDILLTAGLVGLLYFAFIYFTVIKKVMKSDLSKRCKTLYLIMYITYGIYIMFESFGRFSIGSSDTICLIFFITIPLLHAESIKQNVSLDEENVESINQNVNFNEGENKEEK